MRELRPTDRAPLEALLLATEAFNAEEIACALELVDETLGEQGEHPYQVVVAEQAGSLAGYVCFGHTPLTRDVFDLYWIAVDPRCQGAGVGRALLQACEAAVRLQAGRTILIETGGKPSYAATRSFYLRCGYSEVARIPDFYAPGDDKVVYWRRMQS